MTENVRGIFHPVITVSNMSEALVFYRDLLGLTIEFDGFHDPAAISQLFDIDSPRVHAVTVSCADRSEIELVEWHTPRGRQGADRTMPDTGIAAVNLLVSDIESIVGRLIQGGYRPASDVVLQTLPDGEVIKVVACPGPDGTTIILVELPEGRTSLGG